MSLKLPVSSKLLALVVALFAAPVLASPVSVIARDKGHPTRCAEEDNVFVVMSEPAVRRFTVMARQPIYGARLKSNNFKADFSHCEMSAAQDFPSTPRKVTLYEDTHVIVRGITYPSYWRPDKVAVEVAGRRDSGFHLLQLFIKHGQVAQEVLVLHAADGYWRARPLPLPQFETASYGSSFLLGPVEESSRPFVRLSRVVIDPRALAVHVYFRAGGDATVTVVQADRRALRLAVELSPQAASGPFFAALRSMYVSPRNADTARVRWRPAPDAPWRSNPAIGFGAATVSDITFDRPIVSHHNTSAPDMLFEGFDDAR